VEIPTAEIIGIIVCLVFSAFFSSSETALTALSDVRLEQLLERHPRWARSLRVWRRNPNGVLTTILIGNNLFNITASALATDLASLYFVGASAIPIAIGIMTFLLLFIGEITPKTFARTYSEALAPLLMNLVIAFHVLFFPVGWVITGFLRGMIRLLGGRERRGNLTEEDIEFIVSLGRRQGIIDKEKEHLLSSIFEFTDTTAREIMVPRTDMVAVEVGSPYETVVELVLQTGFSRIPVFEGAIDKIVGIFYTKNLITPPKREEREGFLASRMRPPVFVPESKKISELLKMFQKERIHMALVVNEFGGTEGIVTLEDVIEELLGEIHDEFDVSEERLVRTSGGDYIADARVGVEELEEELAIEFPSERDYETLGGFLMELSGEVPPKDWKHDFGGYCFQVTEADPHRVLKVQISLVQLDADGRESERPPPAEGEIESGQPGKP
jgi:CBS domain containing-hemolysin-like protein